MFVARIPGCASRCAILDDNFPLMCYISPSPAARVKGLPWNRQQRLRNCS